MAQRNKDNPTFLRFMRWFVLGPALLALFMGLIGRERGEMMSVNGQPLEGFSGITTLVSISAFAGFMFGVLCWILVNAFGEANRFKRK